MSNYNKVIIAGNLTRDPELRYTLKGTAVCKIGLAINRNWTAESGEKKEEVTFVDVDLFGRTAENVAQYMRKGKSILVDGRLKLDSWDDKQTGQKRSKLGVIAESVQFLGGKSDDASTQQSAPPAARPSAQPPSPPVAGDGPPEDDGSGVPF